jgi:hypothetical protein
MAVSRQQARGHSRTRGQRLSRRLRLAGVGGFSAIAVTVGLSALPTAAAADQCTITVTLIGGGQLSFVMNLPAGTPLSSLSLPVKLPVANVSESCAPVTSTGTGSTPPTSTTPASGSTGTTRSTPAVHVPTTKHASAAPKVSRGRSQKSSSSKSVSGRGPAAVSSPAGSSSSPAAGRPVLRGAGGAPSLSNPTFSFALPGPAPLGVPNFFIDSFRIPPFLLPIYQAAGIEYDVPWQVLAAINEIETDYGRNLSISTAGAVGWMQFLPSTWKRWGTDANGDGVADPYNPVDAVFSAARYLHAAGAAKDLGRSVFAYNHAGWYVQSVLLRARLIGGMPSELIGALSGLVQGHFPVAAQATYADDSVERLATSRVSRRAGNAAIAIASDHARGTSIYAKPGSPVIAVNDGKLVKIGRSARLGRFVALQDETGNVYTYAHLGSVPGSYPVPKPVKVTAGELARELSLPTSSLLAPLPAASAGSQPVAKRATVAQATRSLTAHTPKLTGALAGAAQPAKPSAASAGGSVGAVAALVKERLFADPHRAGSYAAGGLQQIQSTARAISSFKNYFSDVLHLARNQYTLQPLKPGAIVVAGTILGRIGQATATQAPHLYFAIQPAGKNAPQIDPKPILDGWKLLEATAVYRANKQNPFFGPGSKNPTIGQVLLMSKQQLQQRILNDPHVTVDHCTSRQIQAGNTDRRILATLEFLSASGLDPTATNPTCATTTTGPDQNAATAGSSISITKINNIPLLGHQGTGSITDITIRRLLTLQSSMAPNQIISLMSYKGQPHTLALPDHNNRIQIAYTPLYGQNQKLTSEFKTILKPGQWIQLINRISQIPEPTIPTTPSKYALKTAG